MTASGYNILAFSVNRNRMANDMSRKSLADREIAEEGKMRSTIPETFPSYNVHGVRHVNDNRPDGDELDPPGQ